MDKKLIISILIGLIIVAGLVFLVVKNTNAPEPVVNGIILFYKIGCPHCEKVDEFLTAKKVAEKVQFAKREVSLNRSNAELLLAKAQVCGLPTDNLGVPFLWDGSACYEGDQDIINFFQQKIGA